MSTLELAQDVHGSLSRLIAPATPESLRSSTFSENLTLRIIAMGGAIGFLLFLLPKVLPYYKVIFEPLSILGAAILGATFNALYTAKKYFLDKTFNPAYSQTYIIRFALGLFAGIILGNFGHQLLALEGDAKEIGQVALALIGGYSAEAVAQILQRLADMLVTMVRGSDKEKIEAETRRQRLESNAKIASEIQRLDTINDNDNLRKELQKIIQDLLK